LEVEKVSPTCGIEASVYHWIASFLISLLGVPRV
jgi:hypothetical protein